MPGNFDLSSEEVVNHLGSVAAKHMEYLSHWARNIPNASVAGVNILEICEYDIIQALNNAYLRSYIQEKGNSDA